MSLPVSETNPGMRAKLATLLFLIALLLGNGALIGGLEKEGGLFSAGASAIACVLWWISYRISRSVNGRGMTLGFVALGLGILGLACPLALDFHHYVVDHVFWATTAILVVLVAAIALSDTPSDRPKTSPSPD